MVDLEEETRRTYQAKVLVCNRGGTRDGVSAGEEVRDLWAL